MLLHAANVVLTAMLAGFMVMYVVTLGAYFSHLPRVLQPRRPASRTWVSARWVRRPTP